MSYVYLLHFARPYPGSNMQHYVGQTHDLEKRLRSHRLGKGAKFTRIFYLAGIGFTLALSFLSLYPGKLEYQLRHPQAKILCPECNQDWLVELRKRLSK